MSTGGSCRGIPPTIFFIPSPKILVPKHLQDSICLDPRKILSRRDLQAKYSKTMTWPATHQRVHESYTAHVTIVEKRSCGPQGQMSQEAVEIGLCERRNLGTSQLRTDSATPPFGEDHSQMLIRPWPEVDTCKKGEVLARVLLSSRKPKGLVFFATPILHLEFLCSAL